MGSDPAVASPQGSRAAPAGAAEIGERLAEVRRRIAAVAGEPSRVAVVAVTKGFGVEVAAAAWAAGADALGENYAQELLAKATDVPGASWHLVGPPQRNKMAQLAGTVALWEAVDRLPVVERLARVQPGARLLVQVNVTGEAQKAGCRPEEAAGLVDGARRLGLDPRGLMCVGPAGDPGGARRAFDLLAALGRDLGLPELSMGMSDDFELAVEAGSTMVRLGRRLFGPRPGRKAGRR